MTADHARRTRSAGWLALGAFLAGSGVAAGAFGAHGLKAVLSVTQLSAYQTAVDYQLYHALALCVIALGLRTGLPVRSLQGVAMLFSLGIGLFSGSLYIRLLSDIPLSPLVTPLGGVLFMLGWLWLGIAAIRMARHAESSGREEK